jgi:C-terminal processing protease CtpA/Prc
MTMRTIFMTAALGVALATPVVAGQNAAARVYVQAAGADGAGDSAEDVKKEMAELNPALPLALAKTREEADLVLEITGRHTEEKMNYDLTPPEQWTFSILTASLVDGDRSTPLKAETSVMLKAWRTAASTLVTDVRGYVERNHHTLLRRRSDWPPIGLEFEELTKDRKKQYGVKDGKVVVTAIAPGGAGERAGLRAGDVIATLDGEKVKNPVQLARSLYARGAAPVSLGVVQGGANRTISIAVP